MQKFYFTVQSVLLHLESYLNCSMITKGAVSWTKPSCRSGDTVEKVILHESLIVKNRSELTHFLTMLTNQTSTGVIVLLAMTHII